MKYQLCILLAMCTIHLQAQTWISLTDSANNARGTDIEVLVSDVSQYLFKVTINGFYKKDTVVGDATYNQLYINEYETLNEVGCPELPVVNQLIGLPKGILPLLEVCPVNCSGCLLMYFLMVSGFSFRLFANSIKIISAPFLLILRCFSLLFGQNPRLVRDLSKFILSLFCPKRNVSIQLFGSLASALAFFPLPTVSASSLFRRFNAF